MAASRMIRNWTESDTMDSLSPGAEVFFTRLIMVVDDYGAFHANPKLLKAALFPLKSYTDVQVAEWLDECLAAKREDGEYLVIKYCVGGKSYVQITKFGQTGLKRMKRLFPEPDGNISQPPAISRNSPQPPAESRKVIPEVEVEVELERETELEHEGASAQVEVWPTFDDWWDLYDKKIGRPKCEKLWKKISHPARADIMAHTEKYVKATPDLTYRKHPQTYLNNESWNDEIVQRNGKSTTNGTVHSAHELAKDFSGRTGATSGG